MNNEVLQIEYACLACMLQDETACMEGLSTLSEDDFSTDFTQEAFRVIAELIASGSPVDETIIKSYVHDQTFTKNYNSFVKNVEIKHINFRAYFGSIKEHSKTRQLKEILSNKYKQLNDEGLSADTVIAGFYEDTISLVTGDVNNSCTTMDNEFQYIYDVLDGKITKPDPNVTTGFRYIDDGLKMNPSDYILVAARPGVGKTAFLIHLVNETIKAEKDVLIFSVEMPKIQLSERYLSMASKIAYWKIRAGKGFTEKDFQLLETAKPKIDKFKKHVLINDNSRMNITHLSAIAKKEYIRNPNISAIFVDYVQLMQTGEDLNVETSQISRGLKQVARELQVPVVALSQLSRKLESRPIEERKPILSDLRDSGSLEQDADAVVFLYAPYMYTKADKDKGVTSLICAKQRNGMIFEHDMGFDGSIQTFKEMP